MKSRTERATRPRPSAFRDLPLLWKLLVPFLTLLVVGGSAGAFVLVRDLSARARSTMHQELLRQTLDARTSVHDRELYLLESVNLAANLEGMAGALRARDAAAVTRLLRSVQALKTGLSLLVATDQSAVGLVELGRDPGSGTAWTQGFVRAALEGRSGEKESGFMEVAGRRMLAVAAPVCPGPRECAPVGVVIAAVGLDDIGASATGSSAANTAVARGVAIYDWDGTELARSGRAPTRVSPSDLGSSRFVRRVTRAGTEDIATLYVPLVVQGGRIGTLAVTVLTSPAFASVRSAGVRLAFILLAAMLAIFAIGWAVSRFILGQVRPLLATSRAIGRGDLSARATVRGRDELGELAEGVNEMAAQLEASYGTLELRVAERTEEVRRLLQDRTELFASISHEFRTPLAVILRQAEVMRDPAFAHGERWRVQSSALIEQAGQQVLSLIEDILDLARAEAGRIDVDIENVRLPEVLDELRRTIEGLAAGSSLRTRISVPRDLPAVRADRARLRQIVLNLVDNAVKYTPPGGEVALGAARRNGRVEVSVTDTGIGMPESVGDRIFEPFYRVEGVAPFNGQASSGLGLSLAKRLVEAHGGEMTFVSRPGSGTTFTFTLVPAQGRG